MALTSAERESQTLAGADDTRWRTVSGTTDIDDSAQTETSAFVFLTIAPQTDSPLEDAILDVDLAKATTGLAAVETSITLTFYVATRSTAPTGGAGRRPKRPFRAPRLRRARSASPSASCRCRNRPASKSSPRRT